MNTEIREFQDNVLSCINQSNVPLEVKRLVVRDIYIQLERLCNEAILQERQMREQENQKKEQNNIVEEATE